MEKEVQKSEEEAKLLADGKEESKESSPIVLRAFMHCEGCATKLRRCLKGFDGVENAEADLKRSEVAVKGTFEALHLVEYVTKKMGKQTTIVKQDPEPNKTKKPEDDKGKDAKVEKKEGDTEQKKEEKKPEEAAAAEVVPKPVAAAGSDAEEKKVVVDLRKNEFNCYQTSLPRYAVESAYGYSAAPQLFSDENPNACSVM